VVLFSLDEITRQTSSFLGWLEDEPMVNARNYVLTRYDHGKLSGSSLPLSTPPFRSTGISQLGVNLCASPRTCCASPSYIHKNTTYTALLAPFAVISAQVTCAQIRVREWVRS